VISFSFQMSVARGRKTKETSLILFIGLKAPHILVFVDVFVAPPPQSFCSCTYNRERHIIIDKEHDLARRILNPLLSFSTITFLSSIIFQTDTSCSQSKILLKHQPCSSSFTLAFLLSLAAPPSSSRAVRPPDTARTLASSIGVVPSQQRAPTPPAAPAQGRKATRSGR
jgi:hypothetical protein